MLLIKQTEQKVVTVRWAIINQASAMPGINIKNIASKFLSKHCSDLFDRKGNATPPSATIDLLFSED
jgi:hypothetical protein